MANDLRLFFPALIDRSPITVAIGSGGHSPVLARFIKAQIEKQLPANIGMFAEMLGKLRPRLLIDIPARDQRQLFVERLTEAFLAAEIRIVFNQTSKPGALNQAIENWLQHNSPVCGKVFFVGAGPGDPELLTLKAYRILQNCDVVLYDHLVADEILEYIRRDAKKISVGKRSGNHSCTQNAIHKQMLEYAQAGLQVVRLKGGDPSLFSRLGEEIEFLLENQIAYEVVPGITAALGCAASLKIPLTHRMVANGCFLMTAHTCNENSIDWLTLAMSNKTLVCYMGVKTMDELSKQLIAAGLAASTPMTLVIDGTRAQQQIFSGTLADLSTKITHKNFQGPGLIIIGQVLHLLEDNRFQDIEELIYGS